MNRKQFLSLMLPLGIFPRVIQSAAISEWNVTRKQPAPPMMYSVCYGESGERIDRFLSQLNFDERVSRILVQQPRIVTQIRKKWPYCTLVLASRIDDDILTQDLMHDDFRRILREGEVFGYFIYPYPAHGSDRKELAENNLTILKEIPIRVSVVNKPVRAISLGVEVLDKHRQSIFLDKKTVEANWNLRKDETALISSIMFHASMIRMMLI